MEFENESEQRIDYYSTRREDKRLELASLKTESERLLKEIRALEFKKNNLQNIEILQPPISSPHPAKRKIKLNVMLATVVGVICYAVFGIFCGIRSKT